jgi:hypothetical protein
MLKSADVSKILAKFSLLCSLLLYYARELWWTSQEFSPAGIIIIAMVLHPHISPGR